MSRVIPDYVTCPFCETQQRVRGLKGAKSIKKHLDQRGMLCKGWGVAVNYQGVIRHHNLVGVRPVEQVMN